MSFDHQTEEAQIRQLWADHDIYRYDPTHDGAVFAVDTPPPYVSADHLHVGHAMSYAQAEFVVRWHRMRGARVFYPMGFDDNGLPTERYVEKTHRIDKSTIRRSDFRALCLAETQRGAQTYEALWRSLGLSVDWSLRYSTIDEHCQRTAQRSFVELAASGHIVRDAAPVMWDPEAQCALAQADVVTAPRRQKLHRVHFTAADGRTLGIATTRPELVPACVALYRHPDDDRYADVTAARVPLSDRIVPLLTDPDVDCDFGTGLLMTSTFGDAEDVRRWRRDQLDLRLAIGPDGRMTEIAGPDLAGRPVAEARARIVRQLAEHGLTDGFTMTPQQVPQAERTEAAVEWQVVDQWSLRLLDDKDRFRAAADQIRWHPPHMKARLDHWIDGLAWNWSLSRQRFYGVPIPAWLCDQGHAVLARIEDLPLDPLETPPPVETCPTCGRALHGDPDVLDTWMTSSLTPQIHANWAQTPGRVAIDRPMTVRVQAHEIIRTWLFYTLVKAQLHHDDLPWQDVMISGWGLDEQGKKISKRALQSVPKGQFNRYDPAHLIEKYGADAVRHWAARSQLGHDLRFSERDVKAGRRTVVKLWNAARLADQIGRPGPDAPPPSERPPEDQDILHGLDAVVRTTNEGLAAYDYARGLAAIDRFFFDRFCDNWLETIKDRVYQPDRFGPRSAEAARATCDEALRTLIGLYAPYLPFVTEAIWQRRYRSREAGVSLHTTRFPEPHGYPAMPQMVQVWALVRAVRAARTKARVPPSRALAALTIEAPDDLGPLRDTLIAATRATRLDQGPGTRPVPGTAWRIDVSFAPGASR